MTRTRRAIVLAIGLVVVTAPAHADKCISTKLKIIGKAEKALIACHAKVAIKGDPSLLSACTLKAQSKYAAAFGKAGSCSGDQLVCGCLADNCAALVRTDLPDPGPSKCEAARLKASGKKARAKLGCNAKAAAENVAVDPACIQKAEEKYQAAFAKTVGCSGDPVTVEGTVDADCVTAVGADATGGSTIGSLCPSCTPMTTTTTTTSTTTTTAPPPCHFPATGQTGCWDSLGDPISCSGTGQDGEIQAGAPLSYTDNGDGTVTDDNTGLMWEKQSRDGTVHDVGNTYTWDGAFSAHVAALNSGGFAGHTDWRLPNVRELATIATFQNASPMPAVSAAFDTNCTPGCTVLDCSCTTRSVGYWSSTSRAPATGGFPTSAYFVSFAFGTHAYVPKSVGAAVRAVRGQSPCVPVTGQTTCWSSSGTVISCAGTGQDGELQKGTPLAYTDNGDGTITDGNTGLTWEKLTTDNASVHWEGYVANWEDAVSDHVAALNGMSFAGHTDWRLPNIRELASLLHYEPQCANCAAVSPGFSDDFTCAETCPTCNCTFGCTGVSCFPGSEYWTSTTETAVPGYTDASQATVVDFVDGTTHGTSKILPGYVRAVRGGE